MNIVFWSNVHGQAGVTSNLAAISLYMTLKYRFNALLMHNEFSNSSLDEVFLSKNELDDSNNIMFDIGIDALIRYSKYNKLDKESISNYTTSVLKGKLDLLQGTTMKNKNEFYNVLNEANENLFYNSKKYYDFIFSDATAGNYYSNELLENADLIVVNLNQNIRIIRRFFKSNIYEKYKDKCVYIIGKYNKKSKYNKKNLIRKFEFNKTNLISKFIGSNEKLGVIPYNIEFCDSLNEGKVTEYFLKNLQLKKNDINYYFFNELKDSVEMILKNLEIDTKINRIGEIYD